MLYILVINLNYKKILIFCNEFKNKRCFKCHRYCSRAYKWVKRYTESGLDGLKNRKLHFSEWVEVNHSYNGIASMMFKKFLGSCDRIILVISKPHLVSKL
jgi:hypothetical protein